MKKEFVVLIPVDFDNAKEIANVFIGQTFNSIGEIAHKVTAVLVNDEEDEDEQVLVYSVEALIKALNNQDINMEGYFAANVFVVD
jgi:hypothetical protein